MFWIVCLLLAKRTSGLLTNKVYMSRHPQLDERNITTSIISSFTGPEPELISLPYCAEMCADMTECSSFFYNSHTSQCQFHEDLFMTDEGTTIQPGVRYYYRIKDMNGWCPVEKGFQLLSEDGPCVKFHTDKKTWYEANQTCVSYSPYSRLVVLDTQEKNDLVKAAGMAIHDHFSIGIAIGLSKHGEGTFRWVDGKEVDFTDWGPNEIDIDEDENCVVFRRNGGWIWVHLPCTHIRHYICEIAIDIQLYRTMMNISN